ncbi:MAG TPA: MopE-related protein [Sandaracinaceae bacterium LLY-WYZ-13_1]|nr:MopE-related protein [Sandaracinaceae bacterium LLY-WYZ-13_1]
MQNGYGMTVTGLAIIAGLTLGACSDVAQPDAGMDAGASDDAGANADASSAPDTGPPPPDAGPLPPDGGPADAGPDCDGAADGTSCGALRICLSGDCVMSSCGDGYVDVDGGEDCEDGNVVDGDGCESNCRWTCSEDTACDDMNVCNGTETCGVDHTCSDPPDMTCDDSNPCTMDDCDAVAGCQHTLIDGDGDGYAPISLGACGTGTTGGDCNDSDNTVFPTASDGCGGADNDCDGLVDEDGADTYFSDCDGDGYAPSVADTTTSCGVPSAGPSSCSSGGWTTTRPSGTANTDCDDGRSTVFPGASEEVGNGRDDDCDGRERCYRDRDGDGYRTDEVALSSDADCSDSGEAPASADTEWASPGARHACCDYDANVHAGQSTYFTFVDDVNGNEACPGGRRWDYNCNGTESRQYTRTVHSCFWEPAGCSRGGDPDSSGWYTTGSAPPCGAVATPWVSNCHITGATSCSWDFTTRYQGCR